MVLFCWFFLNISHRFDLFYGIINAEKVGPFSSSQKHQKNIIRESVKCYFRTNITKLNFLRRVTFQVQGVRFLPSFSKLDRLDFRCFDWFFLRFNQSKQRKSSVSNFEKRREKPYTLYIYLINHYISFLGFLGNFNIRHHLMVVRAFKTPLV